MLSSEDSGKSHLEATAARDADAFAQVVKIIGDGRRVLVVGPQSILQRQLADHHCRVSTVLGIRDAPADVHDVIVFTDLADVTSPIESITEAHDLLAASGYVIGMALNAMHCANRLALLGANPVSVSRASLPRTRLLEIFETAAYNVDMVEQTIHSIADGSPLLPPVNLTEFSAELIDALLAGKDSEVLTFIVKATPIAGITAPRIPQPDSDTIGALKRELGEQRNALAKAMTSIDTLSGKLGSLFDQLEVAPEQRVIALDRFRNSQEPTDPEKSIALETQLRNALNRESELLLKRDELVKSLAESRAALTEDRRAVERLEAQLRSSDGTLHELRAELKILGRLNAESERAVVALRAENNGLREGSEQTKALITSLVSSIRSLEEEVSTRNASVVGTYRVQHNAVQQRLNELYASPFWAVKMVFVAIGNLFHGN